jgi:hypothetical protein
MRYGKISLFVVSVFAFGMSMKAQEAIPASGGNASGAGGSVSYTIGQVACQTSTATSGTVNQGVQQSYEVFVVTGVPSASTISLECLVFPNPATDRLILSVKNVDPESLIYQLFDIHGNMLDNQKIENSETTIETKNLVPASYFLKIIQNNREIKTFKIIKF